MKSYGYVRVSTLEQNINLQKDALLNYGINNDDIYIEKASGTKLENRNILKSLLDIMQNNDTLVVWKYDRLGRNLRDILNILHELKSRNIKLYDISFGIDSSTVMGNFMIQLLGSVAEIESNLNKERINAGLKAAKLRGKSLGRKANSTKINVEHILRLYSSNPKLNVSELCRNFKITNKTFYNYLKKYRK